MKKDKKIKKRISYFIFILISIITVFPFYWMIVIATNENQDILKIPPTLMPGDQIIENLERVFAQTNIISGFVNTIIVTFTVTILVVFLSSLAGFAFSKLHFKGKNLLFLLIVITMMIPVQLAMIPNYLIITELGWLNSLKAVIIPSAVNGFGIFWMRQYIGSTVSDDLVDAARIDGSSLLRTYFQVVLPIIRPGLAILGIIQFMNTWNDYMWPLLVLKSESSQTLQIALAGLQGTYYQDYSLQMAGSLLSVLPLILIFILFSKQIISGLTAGAVKE